MSIKITTHHLKVIHYQTFIHNHPLSNPHCISILRLQTDTSTRTTIPQKEAVKITFCMLHNLFRRFFFTKSMYIQSYHSKLVVKIKHFDSTSLRQVDAITALVRGEVFFRVSATNLLGMPLMMSMGVIFAMIVVFFGLVNSFKMWSVFLRNDIGIPSESFFTKMERVLAYLRVQSYNTKKRIPNFLQICGVSKC